MNLFRKRRFVLGVLVLSLLSLNACGSTNTTTEISQSVETVVNLDTQESVSESESLEDTLQTDTTILELQTSTDSTESAEDTTTTDSTNTTSTTSVSPSSERVSQLLESMTLEERVYQMFIVTPEQLTGVSTVVQAGDGTKSALESSPVGGIIYFTQNLESDEQTTEMLSNTQGFMQDINGIGLFLCVDEEGGVVARIGNKLNANTFENMDVYGQNADPTEAYQIGVQLAENLSKYGFNVDFAPVSDVDLSSGNGLENRCFSADPNDCATMVENVVKGIQDNGISATIKHFPGLGSSTGDTHDDISYLTRTKEEFESVDFIPIKAGINANTDFVMVSHMVVNGLSDDVPCDLSPTIVTEWLRDELGYNGIAITDSHQMSSITKHYTSDTASVMAIQAGIDIILMPQDLDTAVNGVISAVNSGEISEERINQSVTRILNQKEELGLLY